MKKFILLFILSFLLTGCWNYRELNDMAIIGSVGIDYDEENQMFEVSVQIFNAKKTSSGSTGGSGENSAVTYYEQSAKTIHEAFRNMLVESPKKLYIGHVDMIIFGETLAKEHFMDALDFLFRDSESRKDFQLFVTKDCKASDVLKVLTPLVTIPSASLHQTLTSLSKDKGYAPLVTFDEALSNAYGQGIEIVLPTVQIEGSVDEGKSPDNISSTTQDTRLIIGGIGIFKDNNLIGYLDDNEAIGYNFITGNMEESVLSFPCDDEGNYASIEIDKTKSGATVKMKNQITSEIKVEGEAVISEINCKIDLTKQENILKIQDLANERIKEIINNTLNDVMSNYNTDIFGFGNQLYRDQYYDWEKIKDNWYDLFPNINVNINSEIKIINKGSITTSTKEE